MADPITAHGWTAEDPTPEPDPMPVCPAGITGHRWDLTIEEGQPALTLAAGEACPEVEFLGSTAGVCRVELYHSFEYVDFESESIPVSLAVRVEKSGYPVEEVDFVVLNITSADAALLTEARTLLAHALEEAGDCPLCDGHGTYPTPINCGPDDTPDPCPLCAVYELLLAPDGSAAPRDAS